MASEHRVNFVADVHIANHKKFSKYTKNGVNSRCEDILKALKEACLAPGPLYIVGDLFDHPNVEPPVIAATIDALKDKEQVVIIPGNHDINSYDPDDNALAPLKRAANIEVDDSGPVLRDYGDHQIITMPSNGQPCLDYVLDYLEQFKDKIDKNRLTTICFHAGIIDSDTSSFLLDSPEAINVLTLSQICMGYNVNNVVAGHWHDAKRFAYYKNNKLRKVHGTIGVGDSAVVIVSQIGTMFSHSFMDGIENGVVSGCEVVVWKHRDYFDVGGIQLQNAIDFQTLEFEELKNTRLLATPTYLRIKAKPEEFEEAKNVLKSMKGTCFNFIDGEVAVNIDAVKKKAKQTAIVLSESEVESESMDSSLSEYMKEYGDQNSLADTEVAEIKEKVSSYMK